MNLHHQPKPRNEVLQDHRDRMEGAAQLAVPSRQAARILGISERHLWNLTKSGGVPHVRMGRSVRYPIDALRRWLDQNQARTGPNKES